MKTIIPGHWTDKIPGTGLCNIRAADRSRYEAAITSHGNANIVISEEPIRTKMGRAGPGYFSGSLHCLGVIPDESTAFWEHLRDLEQGAIPHNIVMPARD